MTEPSPPRAVPGPPRPGPGPARPMPGPGASADAAGAPLDADQAGQQRFAGLDERPVAEHVAVYEAEHSRLQRELGTIDQL